MGALTQFKTPDNTTYNLSIPFIIGTSSTAGTWLGTLDGLTEYYDGLIILYKPSVKGASTTTLNLNGLGAKNCYINNTTKLTTHFPALQPILLVYSSSQNSGCWMCLDNYWTDNTVPSAISSTAAATAAKVASCSYYTANADSYIHVVMRYSNTKDVALTLNINSAGAKPIYINGEVSSSTNYTLPAGSYLVYYDGTNYYFRTDGKLTADITGSAEALNVNTNIGSDRRPVYIDSDGKAQPCLYRLKWDEWNKIVSDKALSSTFYIILKWGSTQTDPLEYTISEISFLIKTKATGYNIQMPLHIPVAAITATTSATKQIIRTGYFQNGNNGGEASIGIYKDTAQNRLVATLDNVYINGAADTGATVDVYAK